MKVLMRFTRSNWIIRTPSLGTLIVSRRSMFKSFILIMCQECGVSWRESGPAMSSIGWMTLTKCGLFRKLVFTHCSTFNWDPLWLDQWWCHCIWSPPNQVPITLPIFDIRVFLPSCSVRHCWLATSMLLMLRDIKFDCHDRTVLDTLIITINPTVDSWGSAWLDCRCYVTSN